MSALPPIRRLRIEDFASQKAWITPLILIYNGFVEAVVGILNKSLTITDNTTGDIKQVTLTAVPTPDTNNSAVGPTTLQWTKKSTPTAVLVANVQQLTGSPPVGTQFTLASAVQVQWIMDSTGKVLKIIGVTGITPSVTTQYLLTLVVHAG